MKRILPALALWLAIQPGSAASQFAPPPQATPGQQAPAIDVQDMAAKLGALQQRRDVLIERERLAIEAPAASETSIAERDGLSAQLEQARTALDIDRWVAQVLEQARVEMAGQQPGPNVLMLAPEALARPLPAQMTGAAYLLDAPNGAPGGSRQVAAGEIVIRLGVTTTGSQALIWSGTQGYGYVRTDTLGVYGDE